MKTKHHNVSGRNDKFSSDDLKEADSPLNRRGFVKLAAAVAACGAAERLTEKTVAQDQKRKQAEKSQQQKPVPPLPPPNSLAPAIQFQAVPSGSGAFLESVFK